MVERARRLRVRPSQSNPRGPWESPPGPTTWVRPKGLVERMNAGRKPLRDQGDLANGSFRFQKAVPRTKEKRRSGAPKGAPARVMGRQFPPAGGTGPIARRANGCGVPRPRLSALRFPLFGSAKGSKPTIWTEARRDAPRGNAPARVNG